MIITFWLITVVLLGLAFCFVLPWVHKVCLKAILSVFVFCLAYSVYYSVGTSQYLKYYYSTEIQSMLKNHTNLRVLLGDLRKKEFNFHVRLEENPNDKEAVWNLLNIMGIEAYENQQYPRAIQYWEEALMLIPKVNEHLKIRSMIERLVSNAKMKE
jgi:hypothetical protein